MGTWEQPVTPATAMEKLFLHLTATATKTVCEICMSAGETKLKKLKERIRQKELKKIPGTSMHLEYFLKEAAHAGHSASVVICFGLAPTTLWTGEQLVPKLCPKRSSSSRWTLERVIVRVWRRQDETHLWKLGVTITHLADTMRRY